jgi:hypothetical protein
MHSSELKSLNSARNTKSKPKLGFLSSNDCGCAGIQLTNFETYLQQFVSVEFKELYEAISMTRGIAEGDFPRGICDPNMADVILFSKLFLKLGKKNVDVVHFFHECMREVVTTEVVRKRMSKILTLMYPRIKGMQFASIDKVSAAQFARTSMFCGHAVPQLMYSKEKVTNNSIIPRHIKNISVD